MNLTEQLTALCQLVGSLSLSNEVMLADLVELSAELWSSDRLKDLIQRGMEHHFIDCVRANAGIVLTFSNLGPRFEMMTSGEVLAELG